MHLEYLNGALIMVEKSSGTSDTSLTRPSHVTISWDKGKDVMHVRFAPLFNKTCHYTCVEKKPLLTMMGV